MQGIYYVSEQHNFKYLATVNWPQSNTRQQDWVTTMFTLEEWLEQHCGEHYLEWAYAEQPKREYWQACIAFRQERNKTLFLLQWG